MMCRLRLAWLLPACSDTAAQFVRTGNDGQQHDRTTQYGLRMGLFIVQEIARAHHGEVTTAMADGLIRFRGVLPRVV